MRVNANHVKILDFFIVFYEQYVNEYSVNYPIAYATFYPG